MRSENITIKSAKLTLHKRLYTTNTPFLMSDVETSEREETTVSDNIMGHGRNYMTLIASSLTERIKRKCQGKQIQTLIPNLKFLTY